MKSFSLTLLFVLTFGLFFAQNLDKDSVFIKSSISEMEFRYDTLYFKAGIVNPPVLVATQALFGSDRLNNLMNNGLYLVSLGLVDECDDSVNPKEFNDYPKFRNIERGSKNLIIDVSIVSNCCHNFLGEAEVIGENSDTLNLIYHGYGGFCSCSCCFTLRYNFRIDLDEEVKKIKYIKISGRKSAITTLD